MPQVRRTTRRLTAAFPAFPALLALSACGTGESDSGSGPGDTTNAPKTDAAEAPLVLGGLAGGREAPEDYEGCEDESGTDSAPTWVTCDEQRARRDHTEPHLSEGEPAVHDEAAANCAQHLSHPASTSATEGVAGPCRARGRPAQ